MLCQTECTIKDNNYDVYQCAYHCANCIERYDCWSDGLTLIPSDNRDCINVCWDTCDELIGADVSLCDCSHEKCMIGCEVNCDIVDVC